MNFIGIDPGLKGGIAIVTPHKKLIVLESMPINLDLKYKLFKTFNKEDIIYIENVHSMPTDSRRGSFTFGYHCGQLHTILFSLGLSYSLVNPMDWQGTFGLKREKGESKYGYKKRLLERARSYREASDRECGVDLCSRIGINKGDVTQGRRYRGRKDAQAKTFSRDKLTLKTCDAYLIALHAINKSKEK